MGNVYRQLPLYCFLEKQAKKTANEGDTETNELIVARNARYLGMMVEEENNQTVQGNVKTETVPEEGDDTEGETMQAPLKSAITEKPDGMEASARDSLIPNSVTPTEGPSLLASVTPAPEEETSQTAAAVEAHPVLDLSPEKLGDFDYLLGNFYIVDGATETNASQLDAARFLGEDLTMKQDASLPQILIYHSHSQETFADSREGETEDTVIGVGNYLTALLTETYGYNVIHVTETFDIIDGEIDRSKAYDCAREYVEQVLKENPSVEVVIDLHRDGVPEGRRLVTEINGKDTAQIMFYNGLSYTVNHGPVEYLPNPYIEDNLAFSFQLEYQAAQYYPDLYRGIYLAGLRYNLHLRPKALLLEAGAQTNTVQEVKNAMEPFADILNRVLKGE